MSDGFQIVYWQQKQCKDMKNEETRLSQIYTLVNQAKMTSLTFSRAHLRIGRQVRIRGGGGPRIKVGRNLEP